MLEPHDLAEALRLLLNRTGMRPTELAEAAGLSSSTVPNYLRSGPDGRVPNARDLRAMVCALAEKLEVDPEEMWHDVGDVLDRMPMRDAATPARVRIAARRRVRGRPKG